MNELGIFRREFRNNQAISDEIKTSIYFIKDPITTFIATVLPKNKNKEKLFWLDSDGIRNC